MEFVIDRKVVGLRVEVDADCVMHLSNKQPQCKLVLVADLLECSDCS